MSGLAAVRKPLGVRATADQHRILTEAAARANRSVSSFVLTAALDAASGVASRQKRSPEEIRAIVEAAREEVRKHNPTNRNLEKELIAERRAEAGRE